MTTTRPDATNYSSTAHVIGSLRPITYLYQISNKPVEDYSPPATSTPPTLEKTTITTEAPAVENLKFQIHDCPLEMNPTKSFHEVYKLMIEKELYFVKINPDGSPMSAMEAAIAEVCHFLIGDLAATAKVLYRVENGKKIPYAVASKAIPNFSSLIQDPLVASDLEIQALKQDLLPIDKLDEIDEKYSDVNIKNFDDHTLIDGLVSKEDLIKYRKLKRLTIVITLCYIMKDDDMHRGNLGNGNFDNDMKLWDILCLFKESNSLIGKGLSTLDRAYYRAPKSTTFSITTHDLENLPNLSNDQRFMWCTKSDPYRKLKLIEWTPIKDKLQSYISNENSYSMQEVELFKSLNNHPVFVFNKNKTFLNFALTEPKFFGLLMEQHIKSSVHSDYLGGNSILECMHKNLIQRQTDFTDKLIPSAQFHEFLTKYGDYALKVIKNQRAKHNKNIFEKLEKFRDKLPGYCKCDILTANQMPSLLNQAAYIRRGNELYFYNPLRSEFLSLSLSAQKLKDFDEKIKINELKGNSSRTLSFDELQELSKIIQHHPHELIVRKEKIENDYKKLFQKVSDYYKKYHIAMPTPRSLRPK